MTGADVVQPMPTPTHAPPPPHPNEMWGVLVRLRRSGRGAGQPVERDTFQASTSELPSWCHVTDMPRCPQHETLTHPTQSYKELLIGQIMGATSWKQATTPPVPASWATACGVDCGWDDNNGTCGYSLATTPDAWRWGVQHLPPTTVSPCLQGGSGANGPVTTSMMTTSTLHPLPGLQAISHRMDCGCWWQQQ